MMNRPINVPMIKIASKAELEDPSAVKLGKKQYYDYSYDFFLPKEQEFEKVAEGLPWMKSLAQALLRNETPSPNLIRSANLEVEQLFESGQIDKVADFAVGFVKTHMLVESIFDKILPPVPTSPGESGILPEVDRDIFYTIVARQHYPNEMKVEGYVLTNNDAGSIKTWSSKRAKLYFFNFESDEFELTRDKIAFYKNMNIPIIEEMTNYIKETLVKRKDKLFWSYITKAFQDNPDAIIHHTGTTSQLIKADFTALKKYFSMQNIPMGFWVIHHAKYQDIFNWPFEDLGNLVGEVFVNGVKFPAIAGHPVVLTHNKELVSPDELYAFAAPGYLGVQRMMQDFTILTETKFDTTRFKAKMQAGAILMNYKGVAKVTFS